jgi:ribosomal protein S18 acetylase RimI-like enzyme
MRSPTVKTATAADQEVTTAVVVLAFGGDPAARWAWPDPKEYLTHFPQFVMAFGGKAYAQQAAHFTEGCSGAALWLPPGVSPDDEAVMAVLERTGSAGVRKDGPALFERMGQYHPQEPHWYLPFIGVDPSQQGKGFGAALLRHALARCDRDGQLAYLESSNPRNIPLYERHGFEVLGSIQVGTSPPIVPMLRRPRHLA